jgi:CBS domain containing-hemolysin-like protein
LSKGNKNTKTTGIELSNLWERFNLKWVITVTVWTFVLAMGISVSSEAVLNNAQVPFAIITLIIIISIGVLADIVGIAVTFASEKPFHAMAADRVEGAKYAIKLLKNAGPVSNFCNDVIGDICGILSGAAGASIIINLGTLPFSMSRSLLTIVLNGLVAAFTVGGKAVGKSIAIRNAHVIVFNTARFLNFVYRKTGVEIISPIRLKK